MNTDSIDAYQTHAEDFLKVRDTSTVGIDTARRWALDLQPGAEVVEIACGGGIPVTQTLFACGLKLWAIDASRQLLDTFEKRFPDIPTQCASVQECDFFDRRFDAAIAIGLLFLLDENDQLRTIERVAEILRPGARFLFTAPVEIGSWRDRSTGHPCVSLGQAVYEQALSDSGFGNIKRYVDSGMNNYYDARLEETRQSR